MAKKEKLDESNILFLIASPDGVKRCVSVWTVKNMMQELKLFLLISKEAGKAVTLDEMLSRVIEEEKKLDGLRDPYKELM